MAGEPLGGSEGLNEASNAFQAAMDAETPSRSKASSKKDRREPETMAIEDIFPDRGMDRREPEGGGDDEPEIVKRRRADARGNRNFGEVEDARQPTEAEDEDIEDHAEEPDPDEEEPDIDEGEEQEEQEEAAQGELDLNQIVEVNIDGKPHEVSLNEAIRGYIRQETFHQRLGELQSVGQALQQRQGEIATYQQQFVERAQLLEQYVAAFMPKEPDWDALYTQDPGQAARLERQWRTFAEQVGQLQAARAQTQQELASSQAAQIRSFAEANRAHLAQNHPEWRKEANWKRDNDSMRRTARSVGYSDQEIDQLYDARGVEILLKAAKYDRLMAKKPVPVKNGFNGPVPKRGATPSRNARSFDRAEKRLSRTGSLKAAADVFERILDREG